MEGLSRSKERFYQELKDVVGQLDTLDAQAVNSARERVEALHAEAGEFEDRLRLRDDSFKSEIEARQKEFAEREAASVEAISARLADLDQALTERAEIHEKRNRKLAHQSSLIASQVEELKGLYEGASQSATAAEGSLNQSLDGLKARVTQGEAELDRTGKVVASLTDASMRLMEIIDSSSERAKTEFPKAIEEATGLLTGVEDRTVMLSTAMQETAARSERLSRSIKDAQDALDNTGTAIEELDSKLGSHANSMRAKLDELHAAVRALDSDGAELTERTQKELGGAISGLEASIQAAFSSMEEGAQGRLARIADDISTTAAGSVERSLSSKIEDIMTRIEARAQAATGASKEAADQLRDQLKEVNGLASNLELRVAKAREQAELKNDSNFAHRMAMVTESLNSHSIDITTALSSEVTDTAWAAYLKGDRGIFTRRAVKLLDHTEAREIATLYQSDETFRGNVNRYIHDFETMLANMLSTRDGNALGVTMLGSDIGKLYVALAQAIERLRK